MDIKLHSLIRAPNSEDLFGNPFYEVVCPRACMELVAVLGLKLDILNAKLPVDCAVSG